MAVITWQNVDAPRGTYGGPTMSGALDAINNGFSALQGVGQNIRNTEQANFDNAKAQNTGALMNALANITSTGDLQKQMDSGAFSADNLRQQFGGAFDYDTFNKALMARAGQIQADQEGQLKLNQDTDLQAHQGDIARLAALANTNPAAYNQALANTDFGAATSAALAQLNPLMNDTRQNATTIRGQDLSHADNQAQIGLARERFNFEKARQNKADAQADTDAAYAAGQKAALSAGEMSNNDATKAFTQSPEYLALDPAHQAAALKGLAAGFANTSQMTDQQKADYSAGVKDVNQATSALDSRLNTFKQNFALTNPNYLALQGQGDFTDKSVADSVAQIKKSTAYNDNGELATSITQLSRQYNLPPALIASVAQNTLKESSLRLGGLGREGVTLDKDALENNVKAVSDYQKSGRAYDDQQKVAAVQAPIDALKTQLAPLTQLYQRQIATKADPAKIAATKAKIDTLNQAANGVYNTLQQQNGVLQSQVSNTIPVNAPPSYNQGLIDTFRGMAR